MVDRAPAPLAELADTLWLERRLLEYLLFKLVQANLILTADAAPFVGLAIDEVEQVMGRVREAESHRRRVVARVAQEWGVEPPSVSLDFLARAAPEPLRPAFAEHRQGFIELVDEIERVTLDGGDGTGIGAAIDELGGARRQITSGLARLGVAGSRLESEAVRIDDTILGLREELGQVEDVDVAEAVMELQLHEAGYEAALAAFARARQSSLVDFLR